MKKFVPYTLILALLTSCTGHINDPPALPEEPVIIPAFFEEFHDTSSLDGADIRECPPAGTGYTRRNKKGKPPPIPETLAGIESTNTSDIPIKKIKPVNPEQLIAKANADARMSPVPGGYLKGQAIYRYRLSARENL